MAIQRNALVAPFSNNSPLLEKGDKGKPSTTLAFTHQKWFLQAQTAINGSLQISDAIPASSAAPGNPGTLVPFAGGFYLCVGNSSWLKFTGAPF
jgi:hypothetical protein